MRHHSTHAHNREEAARGNRQKVRANSIAMTKLICVCSALTASSRERMLRYTLPPHYILSTSDDKANESRYEQVSLKHAPTLTIAIWDFLKSLHRQESPVGLSSWLTFIFPPLKATRSQLAVQPSEEREKRYAQRLSAHHWPWERPALPLIHLCLHRQSHRSLKAFSMLHLSPPPPPPPLAPTITPPHHLLPASYLGGTGTRERSKDMTYGSLLPPTGWEKEFTPSEERDVRPL